MTAQILRLTRFFTTTVSEELPEHISEREIESEPFAPRHLTRLYRTHFVLSTSVTLFGSLPRPRALRGGRNRALRPGGGVPEATCLWQYGRGHGRAAGPREPVLVHVRENDHGVCSTLCLLYTSPSPRDKRQSRMPSSA